jgi:hypothetical protein
MPNVTALLDATLGHGAIGRFAVVGAGDVVARKKPAPDIYRLVLEQLGVPAGSCIAIEDSANGLMAARRAGITTLATPSAYTRADDLRYAVTVVSDLGEPGRPNVHLGGLAADDCYISAASLRRLRAQAHDGRRTDESYGNQTCR